MYSSLWKILILVFVLAPEFIIIKSKPTLKYMHHLILKPTQMLEAIQEQTTQRFCSE